MTRLPMELLPPPSDGSPGAPLSGHHPAGSPEGSGNAVRVIYRLLRGRILYTFLVGFIGASLGAVLGYVATKPKYETRGVINVQPTIPKVIFDNETSVPMQFFTSFVNKQVTLLKSAPVLALAMESKTWKDAGFGTGPRVEYSLKKNLRAEPPRESHEMIFVSCIHEDARYTSAAVKSVIQAYESLHGNEGSIGQEMIKRVREELEKCERSIGQITSEIRDLAKAAALGTEDLEREHTALHTRVLELEARVDELGLRLREAGVDLAAVPPAPAQAEPVDRDLTPLEIASYDPDMRTLLARELDIKGVLESYQRQGFLGKHPDVLRATADLAGVQHAIKERARTWREQGGVALAPSPSGPVTETLEASTARYHILAQILKQRRDQLQKIDETRSQLSKLQRERAFKQEEAKTISQRLTTLEVEASGPEKTRGRISVQSYGDTPSFPSVDKRKQLAAVGFVAGGGIPVALMLLMGFLDRRFRYSDQAGELPSAPALLGILPVLPTDLDNPEQRAVAAHCVHQVRLLMQISSASTHRKVYAITSPTSGDGKTSLALALGLSFSAAGSRTLLIDFDMIGTGLTSNLRLESEHGLAEALRTGDLNGTPVAVAAERLWVIPSRPEDDHYVSRVSAESVRRLLEQVRAEYDVVLIDTGPMLGSLEAPLVCAEADGVVMVVGHGQIREYVQQAFARVNGIGGRLMGMVFNRATPGDFRRSVSSTSMRSVPRALPVPEAGHRPGADRLATAGPIVRTLALELDAEADAGSGPRLDGSTGRER